MYIHYFAIRCAMLLSIILISNVECINRVFDTFFQTKKNERKTQEEIESILKEGRELLEKYSSIRVVSEKPKEIFEKIDIVVETLQAQNINQYAEKTTKYIEDISTDKEIRKRYANNIDMLKKERKEILQILRNIQDKEYNADVSVEVSECMENMHELLLKVFNNVKKTDIDKDKILYELIEKIKEDERILEKKDDVIEQLKDTLEVKKNLQQSWLNDIKKNKMYLQSNAEYTIEKIFPKIKNNVEIESVSTICIGMIRYYKKYIEQLMNIVYNHEDVSTKKKTYTDFSKEYDLEQIESIDRYMESSFTPLYNHQLLYINDTLKEMIEKIYDLELESQYKKNSWKRGKYEEEKRIKKYISEKYMDHFYTVTISLTNTIEEILIQCKSSKDSNSRTKEEISNALKVSQGFIDQCDFYKDIFSEYISYLSKVHVKDINKEKTKERNKRIYFQTLSTMKPKKGDEILLEQVNSCIEHYEIFFQQFFFMLTYFHQSIFSEVAKKMSISLMEKALIEYKVMYLRNIEEDEKEKRKIVHLFREDKSIQRILKQHLYMKLRFSTVYFENANNEMKVEEFILQNNHRNFYPLPDVLEWLKTIEKKGISINISSLCNTLRDIVKRMYFIEIITDIPNNNYLKNLKDTENTLIAMHGMKKYISYYINPMIDLINQEIEKRETYGNSKMEEEKNNTKENLRILKEKVDMIVRKIMSGKKEAQRCKYILEMHKKRMQLLLEDINQILSSKKNSKQKIETEKVNPTSLTPSTSNISNVSNASNTFHIRNISTIIFTPSIENTSSTQNIPNTSSTLSTENNLGVCTDISIYGEKIYNNPCKKHLNQNRKKEMEVFISNLENTLDAQKKILKNPLSSSNQAKPSIFSTATANPANPENPANSANTTNPANPATKSSQKNTKKKHPLCIALSCLPSFTRNYILMMNKISKERAENIYT